MEILKFHNVNLHTLFSQNALALLGLSHFHINVRIKFIQNHLWNYDWDYIDSVDEFKKYLTYNIESFDLHDILLHLFII